MAGSLWIALMFPVLAYSQSGGEWIDNVPEPTVLCTSHLSVLPPNSLTCHLEDDGKDDDEMDDIKDMTLCNKNGESCRTENGNNVTFTKLYPSQMYNLTIHLKRGGTFWKSIQLKKIIKPKSPWLVNTTYLTSSNRVFIYIGNPYLNDYLKPNNQLFQLRIWSVKNTLVQNTTDQPLIIQGDEYLYRNNEYHVKVRAKPNGGFFDGSWSEWSASLSFRTDTETDPQMMHYTFTMVVVFLLLCILALIMFRRKQIQSFIWPSIPHPKHTLVHIYKPIKGPLVSFNPEVFGDLNIHLVEPEEEVTGRTPNSEAHPLTEVKDQFLLQCSGDTMSCTSSNSGGSDATLLRCESPGDHLDFGTGNSMSSGSTVGILDLRSDTDSMETNDSEGNVGVERLSTTQKPGRDEAYVTMSSFYQIQ
uniref:Fibronectin type-III domain-containing protein n=2 Tax=Esox lucius TaxID=8010 RepID=A0A3P8Z9K2_ESOLU